MSIFIIGGNIGFAISPLLVGWLTTVMGQRGMIFVALPGMLMGTLMWLLSSRLNAGEPREFHPVRLSDVRPAVLLIIVAVLRSWVYFSVLSYMPSFFVQQGSSIPGQTPSSPLCFFPPGQF
jgi:FSR family fosmidomycin resistance protein-like MFS transporter